MLQIHNSVCPINMVYTIYMNAIDTEGKIISSSLPVGANIKPNNKLLPLDYIALWF